MRRIAFTLCALVAAAPLAALAQDLAPGPGADLVENACQGCHGLDTITSSRNNLDGWRSVVSTMVGSGAPLTDAQAEQVSQYLATYYGIDPPPAAPADAAAPAAPAAPADAAAPAAPAAPGDAAPPPAPPAQPPYPP